MKNLITNLLFFSLSTTAIAADISCIYFVHLNDAKAQGIINSAAKGIVIPSLGNKTPEDLAKAKQQLSVSNLPKCIFLRNARHLQENDLQRIEALKELSKLQLTSEEKSLYQQSIDENEAWFSIYSNASLATEDACRYPLLYLSLQKNTTQGSPLIYEQRLVSGKVKTFSRYLKGRKDTFKCGTANAQQNYAEEFLNKKLKPPVTNTRPPSNPVYLGNSSKPPASPADKYFRAKNFKTAKWEDIPVSAHFSDTTKKDDEVFFKYKDTKYRIGISDWNKYVAQ